MNNYILINRTFCEVTPESSELGGFSHTGMIEQDAKVTFSELVQLMKEHNQPSDSNFTGNTHTWFSTSFYTTDYRTGTDREESIHFSHNNTENAAKYWKLAYTASTK